MASLGKSDRLRRLWNARSLIARAAAAVEASTRKRTGGGRTRSCAEPRIPLSASQFAPGSGSDGGSTLASFDVRLVSSRYARGDHGDRHKAMLAALQRAVKLSADKRGGFVIPLSRETWIGLPTNRQTWVVCLERIKVLGRGANAKLGAVLHFAHLGRDDPVGLFIWPLFLRTSQRISA